MKKFQLIGVALVVVFAFGALVAASASAAFLLAEWLLNGVAVTTNDLVEIVGELLLEDASTGAKVLCSGYFDGWVGPNSLDFTTEILNLAKEPISTTPLVGLGLLCEVQKVCEASTPTVDVYPVGLPWESELELLEQTGATIFVDLLTTKANGGKLGWEVTNCLVLGLNVTDECTSTEGASEVKLEAGALLGIFSNAILALAGILRGTCTAAGGAEHTATAEGEGTFEVSGGGELDPSSGP